MSQCRSCEAPVEWAKTRTNKNIPLDIEPVLGGNIITWTEGGKLRCQVVESQPNIRRRISHFATCPNAKEHRR